MADEQDKDTPRTLIQGFLKHQQAVQSAVKTAGVTSQKLSGKRRINSESSSQRPSHYGRSPGSDRKNKSLSISDKTPRTVIQDFMQSQETAPTTRKLRHSAKKAFPPSSALRKRAAIHNMLQKSALEEEATPRTLIKDFIGQGAEETPVVGWRTESHTRDDLPVFEPAQKRRKSVAEESFLLNKANRPSPEARRFVRGRLNAQQVQKLQPGQTITVEQFSQGIGQNADETDQEDLTETRELTRSVVDVVQKGLNSTEDSLLGEKYVPVSRPSPAGKRLRRGRLLSPEHGKLKAGSLVSAEEFRRGVLQQLEKAKLRPKLTFEGSTLSGLDSILEDKNEEAEQEIVESDGKEIQELRSRNSMGKPNADITTRNQSSKEQEEEKEEEENSKPNADITNRNQSSKEQEEEEQEEEEVEEKNMEEQQHGNNSNYQETEMTEDANLPKEVNNEVNSEMDEDIESEADALDEHDAEEIRDHQTRMGNTEHIANRSLQRQSIRVENQVSEKDTEDSDEISEPEESPKTRARLSSIQEEQDSEEDNDGDLDISGESEELEVYTPRAGLSEGLAGKDIPPQESEHLIDEEQEVEAIGTEAEVANDLESDEDEDEDEGEGTSQEYASEEQQEKSLPEHSSVVVDPQSDNETAGSENQESENLEAEKVNESNTEKTYGRYEATESRSVANDSLENNDEHSEVSDIGKDPQSRLGTPRQNQILRQTNQAEHLINQTKTTPAGSAALLDWSTPGSKSRRSLSMNEMGYSDLRTPILPQKLQGRRVPSPKALQMPLQAKNTVTGPIAGSSKTGGNKQRQTRKKKQGPLRLPKTLTKGLFAHFCQGTVHKSAIAAVEDVSDLFWKHAVNDVAAYAHHAGRQTIEEIDVELLLKRQGFVTDKQSMYTLVEKYLPLQYREELIPIARSGNRIEPK